jgi:CubicO group peptidase (beta-lactamase class C family)
VRPRHRSLLLVPAVACCLVACADDGGPGTTDDAGGGGGAATVPVTESGACAADLVEGLAEWGSAGFSGVVVVEDAATSCQVAVGMADRDRGLPMAPTSVFEIGSVTKSFVAAAVLQLAADGALSLDDPIGRYVPGLDGPVAAASVESLLLHTSGLVGSHGEDHVPLSRDDAVAALGGLEVDPAATGRFLYSNAGYTLLALAVESTSGTTYRDHLVERVLPEGAGFWDGEPAPAGTRAVGYAGGGPAAQQGDAGGPHWGLDGSGGVAMSAPQLAGWTRATFDGGGRFDPDVVDAMTEPVLGAEGQGITHGWVRLDEATLGEPALASAGGGGDTGHGVLVVWLPESERALVLASNDDRVTAEDLARSIGPELASGEPIPRPEEAVAVGEAELAALAGTYETDDGGRFDVTVDGDALVVVPSGADALAALLPTHRSDQEVARHEDAVVELLAGRTSAGAEEVELLEGDFGELTGVEVLGSTTEDGELRTYVRIRFGDESVVGWYALNDAGGIEAVDLSGPPSARLTPVAGGFVVEGGGRGDDAVRVTFDDGTTDGTIATVTGMTVAGPTGTLTAERR